MKRTNQEILEYMVDLVQQAGAELLKYRGTDLTKNIKTSPRDFATEADLAAEEIFISAIKRDFPDDAIIAEESGSYGDTKAAPNTWIIDPLDGTYNFANGRPDFGPMIARGSVDEGLEVAAIFEPVHDRMATAIKGEGVWLNGKKVSLEDITTLKNTSTIVGWIKNQRSADICEKLSNHLKDLGQGAKSRHSAISNFMSVLTGERHGYVGNVSNVWDFAPLVLLAGEIGMKATNFNNAELIWNESGQDILLATPTLHESLVNYIKELNN